MLRVGSPDSLLLGISTLIPGRDRFPGVEFTEFTPFDSVDEIKQDYLKQDNLNMLSSIIFPQLSIACIPLKDDPIG